MADIIDFRPSKDISTHLSGMAQCIGCQHKWTAVVPAGTWELECPSCSLPKGRMVGVVQRPEDHWHCQCGNDLYRITPEKIYCANCGLEQVFS